MGREARAEETEEIGLCGRRFSGDHLRYDGALIERFGGSVAGLLEIVLRKRALQKGSDPTFKPRNPDRE